MRHLFQLLFISTTALAGCQQSGFAHPKGLDATVARSIEASTDTGWAFEIAGGPRGPWVATVTRDAGARSISAEHCPALASAIAAFQALPPITGGWPRPSGNPPTIPIPPTRPHGENWRVSSAGFFPDVSQINLTVQGSQGPYAAWAAQTFVDLEACADG